MAPAQWTKNRVMGPNKSELSRYRCDSRRIDTTKTERDTLHGVSAEHCGIFRLCVIGRPYRKTFFLARLPFQRRAMRSNVGRQSSSVSGAPGTEQARLLRKARAAIRSSGPRLRRRPNYRGLYRAGRAFAFLDRRRPPARARHGRRHEFECGEIGCAFEQFGVSSTRANPIKPEHLGPSRRQLRRPIMDRACTRNLQIT